MMKLNDYFLLPCLILFCPNILAEAAVGTTSTATATATATATKGNTTTDVVNGIVVTSHTIFDESDPEAFFIHRWANYLHINTKEYVILDKLSFEKGQEVSQKDLAEAQRLLRAEPFIREAKIYVAEKDPNNDLEDNSKTIIVETWDNWSLLPTVSLSHSGGDNAFSVGIKEDNLLGLGIRTNLKYQSSEDRTGYQVAFAAPINWIKHGTIAANFYDNSDGQAKHLYIEKPFYALKTKNMYSAEYLDEIRDDTIRQNGEEISKFEHTIDYINLKYGWLLNKNDKGLSRFTLGITQDQHAFANLDAYPTAALPEDRDYLYPWIAYEYLQDDFAVLTNVHLITNTEDFNLGWHHYGEIGLETNDVGNSSPVGYHLFWATTRGIKNDNKLLLFGLNGKATLGTTQKDFYQINLEAEYFYQISPKWTAYSKVRLSTSQNNPLDQTFALGDETGVRGYPNDYQHGDNQWVWTGEIRNYPNINLYQLAELGWAVFSDIGQAYGGPDNDNEVSGVIGSVGIGARIYSSKSSYGNVAHIDLTFPMTSGAEINSWEWRFQVKSHF